MQNILYIIAIGLVMGWVVGLIGFRADSFIHILLVIAIIAVILRLILNKRSV